MVEMINILSLLFQKNAKLTSYAIVAIGEKQFAKCVVAIQMNYRFV
jgi:hypothetical protein